MRQLQTICCLFVLLLSNTTFAQKGAESLVAEASHYQKSKRSTYVATNIPVSSNDVETLKEIVSDFFAERNPAGVSLVLMRQKESPAAYHYRFQQMYRGLPVYNASADLVVSKKGILKSITHSLEVHFPKQLFLNAEINQVARNYCADVNWDLYNTPRQMIFHSSPTEVQSAAVFNITNAEGLVKIVVLDLNGNRLFSDMISQLHHADGVSPAVGHVFLPDPLTSAEVAFGGAYVDDNDATTSQLNNELKEVVLETCFNENTGVYELRNDVLKIVDFNVGGTSPNTAVTPPTSTDGEFFFNRSEMGFEEVSVFYHITAMQRHLDAIGFETICDHRPLLEVDARAPFQGNDDADNSFYSSTHRLNFGTGGIDDAEDADVCVHEYGHALSNCANGNTGNSINITTERDAIEEGLCDYFAASYSKAISNFQAERVYNWDGNFGSWAGRTVNSLKQYPIDLADNQYSDAPIWSSVMMEIWDELGREVTDALMMQAMYAFTTSTDMPTAAQFVLDADEMLHDCENFDVLMRYFHKRGMLDFTADAGVDQEICLGESAKLGGKLSNLFNSQIEWTPTIGLDDPNALFPNASPPSTTTYTLTITDNLRNEVYVDGVTVTIKPCLSEMYGDEVELLNSIYMSQFGQGAFLRFPEDAPVEGIILYNSSGQQLGELQMNEDNLPIEIDFSNRPPGVFIIEVRMPEESKVFKLLSAH